MSNYHFNEIEKKWQQYWSKNGTFHASNTSEKPKYYVLDMFPYPSGAGLHVGHPLGYIASDIYARYKRHKGFNVLHPQGYDSFGLPAEQYAIQTGQHPRITTEENIKTYRRQLDQIGFSFDWSRELRTSEPEFYKWTQWIFTELFNHYYDNDSDKAESIESLIKRFETEGNSNVNAVCDADTETFSAEEWSNYSEKEQADILLKYRLTYLAESEVNWCPELGTVLANDEIVNGVSERGGFPVVRKKMTQWSMRISAYAERLLQDLNDIDWPEPLKESQRNWIGKSIGAHVDFKVKGHNEKIGVFTTRPDTIFGVTFMTLAPEHELVAKLTTPKQKDAVEAYIEKTAKRSERERMADVKTISGVFTGAYAEHPFTKEPVAIWIGDYVLAGYGTGAVMAVPCGDQRDYDFANHFAGQEGMTPIVNIFKDVDVSEEAFADKEKTIITNSNFLNDLPYKKAMKLAIYKLEEQGSGQGQTNYRLRDAVFSRQRYWGEPFPVYYKNGIPQMIEEKHLPITLPEVEKYLPTEEGEPPLGRADVWAWNTENAQVVSNDLVNSDTVFPLELNTMPGWAGSSWYFFRYMEKAMRNETFASKDAMNYWQEVDLYIGGSEHATGHLLYARFWTKFLYDIKAVPVKEFAKKLINQGMILGTSAFVYRKEETNVFISKNLIGDENVQPIHADVSMVNASSELDLEAFKAWRPEFKDAEFILEDNKYIVGHEVEKMSKSKYNVVNPDDICAQYGADTLRLYEMFLGPLEQAKPWNTAGITGVHSFLKKLWKLYHNGENFEVTDAEPNKESLKTLHKTIKKVEEDIENFSFNTSVSTFMIAVNELSSQKCNSRAILEPLAVLISPYAPHIAEELWEKLGHSTSIATAEFPKFEEKHLVESSKAYPISFNGKMRFTMELPLDLSKDDIEKAVMAHEKTAGYLDGRTPKKVIVVPGKIVNIVG
ncbi:leucine--tRNA ligase [Croceibacter atlanticus]|jgi:leucyl-tRNA synthetase|uniref:Leucine--tRNA ligase n=1 Tax=Croceibacter atlanticus (strain ATCC BAA-628 / JCM 21780 / CIP 108009 / IAM 15332 / KCTC 12090 / HTCC2559) TaxID=216432 RepID=A3U6X8_CROAH|nr:leucine--tRNA ligase [Croceibacter atlanticus]EAP87995.1 leucyl-tRNA synthetase [Croceibacter atlanticus HTCC2559]